jgi:hypothetical protein
MIAYLMSFTKKVQDLDRCVGFKVKRESRDSVTDVSADVSDLVVRC